MTPGSTERPSPSTDLVVWLGLLVALVGLLATGTPPRVSVLALIVVAITLALSLRWRMAPLAVIVLATIGVVLRLSPPPGFSDVLIVTDAAISEVLAGGDPYGHGFGESFPPGAPFAYGPVALLWYLPGHGDPGRLELLASLLVLGLLAIRGRPLGLAIYAVTPALVLSATDGSNDTSAGLLLLLSLLVAIRIPAAGAGLLAITTAFKPYALAWLPGLIAYAAAVGPLLVFVLVSLLAWGPALLAWGPASLLRSFQRANDLHALPYYSLAYGLGAPEWMPQPAWQALRVAAGVLVAVLAFVVVRSAASMVIMGALVFGATLYLGWWSTIAYVAAVAPVICWHLDDWLGLGGGRAVWPGDPVRTVTEWADSRWSPRRDERSVMESSGSHG